MDRCHRNIPVLRRHPRTERCSVNYKGIRDRGLRASDNFLCFTDVLHDVGVGCPFGRQKESLILEGARNTDKVEGFGMGQVLPHGNS